MVPLGYPLEKFGNKKPDRDQFELTTPLGGVSEQREEFAVANYKKLSDSDKLSAPSFERMRSGLQFSTGDATATGARVVIEVDYELSYVHRSIGLVLFAGVYKMLGNAFAAMTGASSASRNAFSRVRNGPGIKPATVTLADANYLVVGVDDLVPHPGAASAKTMAEAVAQQAALVRTNPALKGKVQVVASHELEAA